VSNDFTDGGPLPPLEAPLELPEDPPLLLVEVPPLDEPLPPPEVLPEVPPEVPLVPPLDPVPLLVELPPLLVDVLLVAPEDVPLLLPLFPLLPDPLVPLEPPELPELQPEELSPDPHAHAIDAAATIHPAFRPLDAFMFVLTRGRKATGCYLAHITAETHTSGASVPSQ
jgi:hypothetical protein